MRFCIAFLLFFLFTGPAIAQTENDGSSLLALFNKQKGDQSNLNPGSGTTNFSFCLGANSTQITNSRERRGTSYPATINYWTGGLRYVEPQTSYRFGLRIFPRNAKSVKFESGIYINNTYAYSQGLIKYNLYNSVQTYSIATLRYHTSWIDIPLLLHFSMSRKQLLTGSAGFVLAVNAGNSSRILYTLDAINPSTLDSIHEITDQELRVNNTSLGFQFKFGIPVFPIQYNWVKLNVGFQSLLFYTTTFSLNGENVIRIKPHQFFLELEIPFTKMLSKEEVDAYDVQLGKHKHR